MAKISKRVLPMAMAAVMLTQANVFAASKYFKDVTTKYEWAQEAIDHLKDSGVVAGFNDGYFRPGDTIKRCDFLIMLYKQFGDDKVHYVVLPEDIEPGTYYEGAYRWAADSGVVEKGLFNPTEAITREDAFGYLYGCLLSGGILTETDKSMDLSKFNDSIDVAAEKREAIATLAKAGIVNGTNGVILPKYTISRAEMAVIFYQAAKLNGPDSPTAGIQEDTSTNVNVVTADSKFNVSTSAETKYLVDNEKGELETLNLEIPEDGKSAVVIQNGGNLTISNSKINKTGKSLTTVNTGNSGINSAVIVKNGSTFSLIDTIINTTGDYSNGISVLGGNNTINIDGAEFIMSGQQSAGVLVTDSSKVNIEDSSITVKHHDKAAVYVSDSGAELKISGSTINAYGYKAAAVSAAGNLSVSDSTLNSEKSVGIETIGNGTANISNVVFGNVKEALIRINVLPKEASDYDTFNKTNITNTSITPDKNAVGIDIVNTDSEIYITNSELKAEDILFRCRYDRGVNAAAAGAQATIILDKQLAEGNVESESNAPVSLILQNGSRLVGKLNGNQNGIVNINLKSGDDILELTGDCYVGAIENHFDYGFSNIKDNGNNIYYDADDDANNWLNEEEYSLMNGGTLMPW